MMHYNSRALLGLLSTCLFTIASAESIDLLEVFGVTAERNSNKYRVVEGKCGPARTILKRHQVSVPTSSIFPGEIPREFTIVSLAKSSKKRKFSHLFNIYNKGYRQLGINIAKKHELYLQDDQQLEAKAIDQAIGDEIVELAYANKKLKKSFQTMDKDWHKVAWSVRYIDNQGDPNKPNSQVDLYVDCQLISSQKFLRSETDQATMSNQGIALLGRELTNDDSVFQGDI
jgi:hypothetical protein